MWGDLDVPHILERSRRFAATVQNALSREVTGVGRLPSLKRPQIVAEAFTLLFEIMRAGTA